MTVVIREVISIDIPAAIEATKRHRIDGIMTIAGEMYMKLIGW